MMTRQRSGISAIPPMRTGSSCGRTKVCEILLWVYRAQAHAAGEDRAEERTVHDGEDTDGSWRSGLYKILLSNPILR